MSRPDHGSHTEHDAGRYERAHATPDHPETAEPMTDQERAYWRARRAEGGAWVEGLAEAIRQESNR